MSDEPKITTGVMREAKRINDSNMDRLWKYLYEPKKNVELTVFEEDMKLRLENIWFLLTGKVLNDRRAVKAHIDWCNKHSLQISERTAYEDVRRAKALYGDPRMGNAIYEKKRISEVLLDLIRAAKAISDLDNAQRLIRRYNAVNGLEDNIKTQLPRAPITINFNSDPETLKKQAAELMKGLAQDVEFTDT
jgi:hypothetical protein